MSTHSRMADSSDSLFEVHITLGFKSEVSAFILFLAWEFPSNKYYFILLYLVLTRKEIDYLLEEIDGMDEKHLKKIHKRFIELWYVQNCQATDLMFIFGSKCGKMKSIIVTF